MQCRCVAWAPLCDARGGLAMSCEAVFEAGLVCLISKAPKQATSFISNDSRLYSFLEEDLCGGSGDGTVLDTISSN